MASLKDIARELDVSVSLVSKVLNNRMGTSGANPKLIEKIKQAAAEMGYQKNATALSLQSGRQNVIGIYVHPHGNKGSGIVEDMLSGITKEAARHGQKQLLRFYYDPEDFVALANEIHRGTMDGLIVAGLYHADPQLVKDIHDRGVKIVTLLHEELLPEVPNAGISPRLSLEIGIEHLIERGCKRIKVISNDLYARHEGIRVMQEKHPEVTILPAPIPDSMGYSHQAGCALATEWIENGEDFDGVMTLSDEETMGVLNALHRVGKRVPEDVKLIGVDDSPMCNLTLVTLSSISERIEERGRLAVDMLMDVIAGKKVKSVVMEPKLMPRQSTENR